MKKLLLVLVTILVVPFSYHIAMAERSIRCGSRLVSIGSHLSKVIEACGEPDYRDQWEEYKETTEYDHNIYDEKKNRYRLPEVKTVTPLRMERWTYNMGSNRFTRFLEFENDILVRIQTGEKEQ